MVASGECWGEDTGYEKFVSTIDGLIMGRGSFDNILTFGEWPYRKPVVVMSQKLVERDIPVELRDKVRISNLAPKDLMKEVHIEGWNRVYVDGGKIVQSFIREKLIDDMIVTQIPILIGKGRRLFGPVDSDVNLKLIGSESFKTSGMVQNHYKIVQ